MAGRSCRGRCGSASLAALLRRRELSPCGAIDAITLRARLPATRIPLAKILDAERQLLRGQVLLGFDRDGDHVISYSCCVEAAPEEAGHFYALHWWRFQPWRPLKEVARHPLFRGELTSDLHLVVCQPPASRDMVVLGCRRSQPGDDCRPCYVSILVAPLSPRGGPGNSSSSSIGWALHFKFDLLPPFPAFIPSLALKIPGVVLVNTGDSLVAVQYEDCCPPPPPPSPRHSPRHSSSVSPSLHLSPGQTPTTATTAPAPATVASPSQLLSVEVCRGAWQPGSAAGSLGPQACGGEGVRQFSLDVELWICTALASALEPHGFTLHSLTDYDLQLVEVCEEHREVVFVAVAILEVSQHTATLYSKQLTASWSLSTGEARVVSTSPLKPLAHTLPQTAARWNPTAALSLAMRRAWHLPTSRLHTVTAFSNHTVFTGRTLHTLTHPHLPLSILLTPTRPPLS